jgi:beta-lactamase superfamily II metal-dependent hydrolase
VRAISDVEGCMNEYTAKKGHSLFLATLWFALFLLFGPANATYGQDLRIVVLSVGQTDSQLIIGPTGRTLLIDCGAEVAGSKKQYEYVAQRLEELTGSRRVDYFVISHYHYDHMGSLYPNSTLGNGIWGLLDREGVTIGTMIDRGEYNPFGDQTGPHSHYVNALTAWRQQNKIGTRVTAQLGTGQIDLGAGVRVEVVAVNGNGVLETISQSNPDRFADYPPSENDYSIALKLSLGEFEYFTGGDITGANEIRDFGSGTAQSYNDIETSITPRVGDVEVLRVSHHGSAHSSNTTFLNTVDPEFSLVSSGSNTYGHPAKEAVSRIEATSRLFVTTGADKSIWTPTDGIWSHVVDADVQISVLDKGARYQIAGIDARSYTDLEEAQQTDANGAAPPLPGGGGGTLVSWMDAPNHIGEAVTVEGQIVQVRVLKTIAFLNFSSQYWRDLTAVIMSANLGAFPADLRGAYLNRTIRVSGTVTEFEGRPQIVIQSPAQIAVQ